jgi:murein DD-endopeptidase MepM/ murein hydrolase activator NlpD
LPAIRSGKGYALAFFLIYLSLPVCEGQEPLLDLHFPVITRMVPSDNGFRQFISDVESNRRRVSGARGRPEETAEHLTIYQYTVRQGDDLFSIAARCNIPYSALASLNRLSSPVSLEAGRLLLLPSCPGIYIPQSPESDLERLIGASRLGKQESVELLIRAAGRQQIFHFFPGADYTPTERAYFVNAGFFRFPLQSFRLTSSYGIRENPVTGNVRLHQGIDLAAPEGTEVYAAADGTVTEIGDDPVYGIYIIIGHNDRWTSLYGHLQRVETVLRSNVKSGTLIGRVGTTGQSTGPHLHFELRQDGRALNPSGRLRP